MTAPENIWAVCDEDVSAQTYDIYAQIGPEGFVDAPTQYIRADRYESLMKERDGFQEIALMFAQNAESVYILKSKLDKLTETIEEIHYNVKTLTWK